MSAPTRTHTDRGFAVLASGLERRFGATVALAGLDLAVRSGEIFGIVGPDGAGKTTLLRMLVGAISPTAGSAEVVGFDVASQPDRVRGRVGYVAQPFALYGDLTVAENLRFFGDVHGVPRKEAAARGRELLTLTGLAPFADRLVDNLSGGMKQKLAVACSLIHEPDLIVLDEPTAGVDPLSRRDIWRILYRLQERGLSIVLTTAYMEEAERCHRVAMLSAGRAIAVGTPDELRGLMGGTLFEVVLRETTPETLRAARVAASGVDGVTGAQLFGDRIHVSVADHAAAGFAAALGQRVQVLSAVPVPPSLEDVFLSARSASNARGPRAA